MILAIDPGNTQSGYVLYNEDRLSIVDSGVLQNNAMRIKVRDWAQERCRCAIEMIASYGMPVGADVFETCVWVGRFAEAWEQLGNSHNPARLIFRKDVKMHLCGQTAGVNDAVIRRRLLDIFGPRGTKKAPGRLYGVKSHAWPALAVAVTAANA